MSYLKFEKHVQRCKKVVGMCIYTGLMFSAVTNAQVELVSNQTGIQDGYYYAFWKNSGRASMTIFDGGRYIAEWDESTNNFFGGMGWNPGTTDKIVGYKGYLNFDETQNAALSLYGWTNNPLYEFFIVESFGSTDPSACSNREAYGSYESDGATYSLYLCQYSVLDNSNYQIYSVRSPLKGVGDVSGSITVGNHFDAWQAAGLNVGELNYLIMATDAYGSTGRSDITVWEEGATKILTQNEIGTHNGFYYSFWKDSGDATFQLLDEGHYTAEWTANTNNWIGGVGLNSGEKDKVISYVGNFGIDESQNGFLGLYSASTDHTQDHYIEEFYVIDSYGSYDPSNCGGVTELGSYQSDGATYMLSECVTPVMGDPVTRIVRYYGVRSPKKPVGDIKGTITLANHFNALADAGVDVGSLYHTILATEGYQSTGSVDLTVAIDNETETISQNKTGEHHGLFYSLWKDSGDASIQLLEEGHYRAEWSNSTNNWLGGIGWKPGVIDKVIGYSGSFNVDARQNAYLGLYIASSARLDNDVYEEYHIIESYGSYNPSNCNNGEDFGSYNIDDATYTLKRCSRYQNGIDRTIKIDNYYAVRNPLKGFGELSGFIPVAEHLEAWSAEGVEPGTLDYMILATEGYQSTGNSDITIWEVEEPPISSSSSSDKSSHSSSSSAVSKNEVIVRMRGTNGSEQVTLSIGGTTITSWTLSTSMQDYQAYTNVTGEVLVEFTNDNGSRDVQVDYVKIAGDVRQAEDQSENTGAYSGGCGGGSYTEMLHCNGYINFGVKESKSSSSSSSYRSSSSSLSRSSSLSSSCVDMCQWYGDTLRPLCEKTNIGWGWENQTSCIGKDTCNQQYGDGGVVAVCN